MVATAKDVAKWMLEELKREETLYQHEAAWGIEEKFGEGFTYTNQNGNSAIEAKVLAEFRKITGDTIVWERGQRLWRLREDYDEPGRQQN